MHIFLNINRFFIQYSVLGKTHHYSFISAEIRLSSSLGSSPENLFKLLMVNFVG